MPEEPVPTYESRVSHILTHTAGGAVRKKPWTVRSLLGKKRLKRCREILAWAGSNFPGWTSDHKSEDLGKATYLSFKSYLVAKVSDKAEKKGKERREFKRALQKDVQPVHQSILAKLKPSDGTPQLTIAQRLATLEARVAALEAKLKASSGNKATEDKQGVDGSEAAGDGDGDATEDHESASEHT